MLKVIVVPVETGALAEQAARAGAQIARASGAVLRLVHVEIHPKPSLAGTDGLLIEEEKRREALGAGAWDMYDIAAQLRQGGDLEIHADVEHGPVRDVLAGYVARHKCDLVVMSSHRRNGLARLWHGSVADTLIRDSRVPVLIVDPDTKWTCFNMLVALDGSKIAEEVIPTAREIAGKMAPRHKTAVTLGCVNRAGASGGEHEETRRYLHEAAGNFEGLDVTTKCLEGNDVAWALLAQAVQSHADVICLATHGRGAAQRAVAGSVADTLLRHSTLSMLVVRPGRVDEPGQR